MRAVKMRKGGHITPMQADTNTNDNDDGSSSIASAANTTQRYAAIATAAAAAAAASQTPEHDGHNSPTLGMSAAAAAPRNADSTDDNKRQLAGSLFTDGATTYTDAEGIEEGDVDPLAEAFALDAPLTLTAREDPQVVARLPLRFHEILTVVEQQLCFRHRQATQQSAIDQPAVVPSSSSALELMPPSPHPPVADFLRERLPLAVGRGAGCQTAMCHPTVPHTAEPASDVGRPEQQQQQQQLTREDEQACYRDQVAEEVLDYLFRHTAPGSSADPSDDGADDGSDAQHYRVVESCLSGLREVPASSVEYQQTLRRLVSIADGQQRGAAADVDDGDSEVELPSYLRQLLVGSADASHRSGSPAASAAAPSPLSNPSANLAAAAPRQPVVAATLRAALDAVLPPRMLTYYLIHYQDAVALQQQRRAALAHQAKLREILVEHPDDVQSKAEMAEATRLLTETCANTVVGVVLIVMERTSDVQAPREYLHGMERTLGEMLLRCRARCCGRPLRTSAKDSATPRPPSSSSSPSPHAFSPTRPADGRPAGNDKPTLRSRAAAAAATTTTIVTPAHNAVCTHTARPPPARPAALSSSGGGSASVMTTLHVVELNAERHLILFDLLGEEALRQVTVDLPERGVLLRHLLDEARLSLEARGLLARERRAATQERLLDGQEERESLARQQAELEAAAAELRERRAALLTKKTELEKWTEARAARAAAERESRLEFEEKLKERLSAHTEAMKAAQEAARFAVL